MANYNSGKVYNRNLLDGGANYNNGPHVIAVMENGMGTDSVLSVFNAIALTEEGMATDSVFNQANILLDEIGTAEDQVTSVLAVIDIQDEISSVDELGMIKSIVSIIENAYGYDAVLPPATTFFLIDSDGILQPLGVQVTRDSRHELLAPTRDITEEIPGAHGEIDLGTMLGLRTLELTVVADKDPDCEVPFNKEKLKRLYAKYLDPTKGYRNLIFSDDVGKTYQVKYFGRIDIEEYANWLKFTIPFKMMTPFIVGSFEKSLSGNGVIENEGTFETGIIVEIRGPATNPSLLVGATPMAYNGVLEPGETLIIDTDKQTVRRGNNNAMSGYNKQFPKLPPGELTVTSSSNVTVKWRDLWL